MKIEYDQPTNIYTIDGVKITAEALWAICGNFPDDRSYRFVRQDDMVKVRVIYDEPA